MPPKRKLSNARDIREQDYEGLDRYLDEYEERIERNDPRFGNRRTGR